MTCAACRRSVRRGTYALAGEMLCGRHAFGHRATLNRSLRIAAFVGTLLFIINQLDVVLAGGLTIAVAAKIALTYAVPFSVATYSVLAAGKSRVSAASNLQS